MMIQEFTQRTGYEPSFWVNGFYKERTLSKSFDTLEEAERFSVGKDVKDIYKFKGRYKVEWIRKEQE